MKQVLALVLYGTSHCHLCEQAEVVLMPFVASGSCQVELCDIAQDESLLARYGTSIPVLMHPETGRELRWPFDGKQVVSFLQSVQNSRGD